MSKPSQHTNYIIKGLFLSLNIFILALLQARGQEIKNDFESFTTKEGLSQNLILSIAQDKKGFIWFGTEDGLNRFDGHDFKIYRHKEKDPNTIVSNSIRALFADEDNTIWIGTDNGVCRLFTETEYIQHFPVDFTDESKLNGSYVSSIQKHEDGSIWISYIGSGIDIIHPDKKDIFHYTIHREDEYKLHNDMVSSLQFLADGNTIIGSYAGVQFLNPAGKVLSGEEASKRYPWIQKLKLSIKSLFLSKDKHTLWIGTEVNGLYKVDLNLNTIQNFSQRNSEITSNDILSISEDSKGNIMIGSDALYVYDEQRNTLLWSNKHGMYIKNHTYSIFEDKDHNLWIGTSRLGVRKINNKDDELRHFHSNQGDGSLQSDEILSFNEDISGNIWIGTGGAGIARMQKDLKGFEHAEANAKLYSPVVKTIHRDKEGNFWMGGWDAGLIKFNPVHHSLEQHHPDNATFNSRHIWDIDEDKEGNLWLATLRDGLCRYSPATKDYTYYKNNPTDVGSLLNDDVQAVHVDVNNVLWVATSNGLSVLLPHTENFINTLEYKSNDQYSISNSVILCLYEDQQGRMWLGSKGGGITIVRLVNNKIVVEQQIKEKDGLTNNTITAIQDDENNNIWVATAKGLAKISFAEDTGYEITPITQLQNTEFLAQSSFRRSDGKLLFGGTNGFYLFHPDSLDLSPQKLNVLFTSLKIVNDEITPSTTYRDRKILKKSITEVDEIFLTHEDYAFTIGFTSVNFNQQKSIRYAYMLENLDKEWQYTTSDRRFVHYTNLSPGSYTLNVKASSDGIHWPVEAKKLLIHVTPPWWATLGFRLLIAVFLGALLYSLYQGRIRFLNKQRRKLEQLVALRTRELRRSHDEIKGLLDEVAEQKSNIESKNEELQQINEALSEQRDTLELKSDELEKAQSKLREINTDLELLVSNRTQKLNNTLHELETFLYRASHDLRGPISSMLGLLQIAKLEEDSGLSKNTYTSYFATAVHRLERSLQKLLQKYTIQKEDPIYVEITKEVILQLLTEISADTKHFRTSNFTVNIEEQLHFKTDTSFLYIMLLSLLENAFFFSEKSQNTKVVLEIKQNEYTTSISVSDWGLGIKEEQKEKIFQMFYRGSVLSSGNGLGLYLVKSIVEKLNGSILLDTEEGCYSRFTILLPNTPSNSSESVHSLHNAAG